MINDERYKLALFAVVRNTSVMPLGLKLGKTPKEINEMSVKTIGEIMKSLDFENLKESFDEGSSEVENVN